MVLTIDEKINNLVQMAKNSINTKNYSEVKSYSNRILNINPNSIDGFALKGIALVSLVNKEGRVDDAIHDFNIARAQGKSTTAKKNKVLKEAEKESEKYQEAYYYLDFCVKNFSAVNTIIRQDTVNAIYAVPLGLWSINRNEEANGIVMSKEYSNFFGSKDSFTFGKELIENNLYSNKHVEFALDNYWIRCLNMCDSSEDRFDYFSKMLAIVCKNRKIFKVYFKKFLHLASLIQNTDSESLLVPWLYGVFGKIVLNINNSEMGIVDAAHYFVKSISYNCNVLEINGLVVKINNHLAKHHSSKDKDINKKLKAYYAIFRDLAPTTKILDAMPVETSNLIMKSWFNNYEERITMARCSEKSFNTLVEEYGKLIPNKKIIKTNMDVITDNIQRLLDILTTG